jgi:hypothetical protein
MSVLLSAPVLAAMALVGYNQSTDEYYANYACGDGVAFSAIFEKRGALLIMIDGGAYRLQNAGAGVWRDSRGQEFRRDGDMAIFIVAGKPAADCRVLKE